MASVLLLTILVTLATYTSAGDGAIEDGEDGIPSNVALSVCVGKASRSERY